MRDLRRIAIGSALGALAALWVLGAPRAEALPLRGLTVRQANGPTIAATFTVLNPPAARYCTANAAGVLLRAPRAGDARGRILSLGARGRWFLVASHGRHRIRWRPCSARGWDSTAVRIRFDSSGIGGGRYMLCVRAWGTLRNGRNQNHNDCRRFDRRG
jgi:hypothetical protein